MIPRNLCPASILALEMSNGFNVTQKAKEECQFIIEWLVERQVEVVIAACTELSILFSNIKDFPIDWIDPMEILADKSLALTFDLDCTLGFAVY